MRSGQLRYRVTIEQLTETQNEYGEPVSDWSPLATVWAEKEDLTGREYYQAQQINAEVTTRFTIRWRDDVKAKMRLKHSGTLYDIASVQDPDGRQRRLILVCSRDT